jgi:hypothetical protein
VRSRGHAECRQKQRRGWSLANVDVPVDGGVDLKWRTLGSRSPGPRKKVQRHDGVFAGDVLLVE